MSNFLCSLLRGYGFDAYVVNGYAPKWVVDGDLTKVKCPFLEDSEEKDVDAAATEEEQVDDPAPSYADNDSSNDGEESPVEGGEVAPAAPKKKYQVYEPRELESRFLRKQRELEQKTEVKEEGNEEAGKEGSKDSLDGYRVHCWVLVNAGRREVEAPLFVEATTGAVYTLENAPYQGVESLWNEKNYWVNLQKGDSGTLSFDLTDNQSWEYILHEEMIENLDAPDGEIAAPPEEENEDDHDKEVLDAPLCWYAPIVIDRDTFSSRYPGGMREMKYHRCLVEKFTPFHSGGHGLTQRVTIYEDDEYASPIEIRSTYTSRVDNLIRSTHYVKESRIHDEYQPGCESGLKDAIIVKNEKRYFEFYEASRPDCLVKREEVVGVKVIETYKNRDDRLIYRSIAVDTSAHVVSTYFIYFLC